MCWDVRLSTCPGGVQGMPTSNLQVDRWACGQRSGVWLETHSTTKAPYLPHYAAPPARPTTAQPRHSDATLLERFGKPHRLTAPAGPGAWTIREIDSHGMGLFIVGRLNQDISLRLGPFGLASRRGPSGREPNCAPASSGLPGEPLARAVHVPSPIERAAR